MSMREIRTSIDIEATPLDVWNVLMDFDAYSEWNPFIRSIVGIPEVEETLDVALGASGKKAMRLSPTVTDLEEPSHFSWTGSIGVPGLFDGHHQFDLIPTDGGTRFEHHEQFSGILSAALLAMVRGTTTRGFEEMNQALKDRVESVHG